jgi:hypothetical protein
MAGSYSHITTDKKGKFRGTELLDHMGDAYEALEECYGMIWFLATIAVQGDAHIAKDDPAYWVEMARKNYENGLKLSPGVKRPA